VNVSAQEQALLDLIEADRTHRCAEILGSARSQAAELLRQAHAQARERVRQGLDDARERARQRVAAAAAQRATRLRLAQQNETSDFLAQAMARMPAALIARWQQPESRLRWVRMALAQARQSLPLGDWRIVHAPGLQADDIRTLGDSELSPFPHRFEVDTELAAGVRVFGNGNCIDASLAGLLSDRDSLAAVLLRARGALP
jgi:vacuolar-type H+-ATPase subunit H